MNKFYSIHWRFDLIDYQKNLIERFRRKCQWNRKRSTDVSHEENSEVNEEYNGFCVSGDVIDVRIKKLDESMGRSSLSCCQTFWTNVDQRQCCRCHKRFTDDDVFYPTNSNDLFCLICWQFNQHLIILKERSRTSIRCNICSNYLSLPLTDEIIALNFVHPDCWQNLL